MVGGVKDGIEGSGHDVAISLADRSDRYTAVLGNSFDIDGLSQIPTDCAMPQCVPDDLLLRIVGRKPGRVDEGIPPGPNTADRLAVKLNHRISADAEPVCTENLNPTIMVMKSAKDGA
jgi:hypothetical protein